MREDELDMANNEERVARRPEPTVQLLYRDTGEEDLSSDEKQR